jgi:anti-sigma-K factor RskA
MKHVQISDELQEKALLYAIGALPEGERREYARHLEEDGCSVCVAEALEFQGAAQSLALAIPPETPSATVRARILAQARAESEGSSKAQPYKSPWFLWAACGAAAAAVAALAITLTLNSDLRRQLDALAMRVNQLQQQVTRDGATLASLTNPQVKVLELSGQGDAPRARGRIFWNEADRVWRVSVSGLPPVSADRAYQLWFVPQQGNPLSAQVFNTDADGSALLEIQLPSEATSLKVAAVTTEPAGGLPAPSGPFVLLME